MDSDRPMDGYVIRIRRLALTTTAVLSPMASVFAVHQLVRPERIELVGTVTLLLVLVLLVLPTLTIAAMRFDRRLAGRPMPESQAQPMPAFRRAA